MDLDWTGSFQLNPFHTLLHMLANDDSGAALTLTIHTALILSFSLFTHSFSLSLGSGLPVDVVIRLGTIL